MIAAFSAEARLLRAASVEGPLQPALLAIAAALDDAGAPLAGLPAAEALTAVASELGPGIEPSVRRLLQAELQGCPARSAVELLDCLHALLERQDGPQNAMVALEAASHQPASELAVLERYDVTADALRRRIVSDLIATVVFPEHAMADVISELMQDLEIPPPIPAGLSPNGCRPSRQTPAPP